MRGRCCTLTDVLARVMRFCVQLLLKRGATEPSSLNIKKTTTDHNLCPTTTQRECAFVCMFCVIFEFYFLFEVRISFSVRDTRPLWETLYRWHEGHGEAFTTGSDCAKRTAGDREPDCLSPAVVFLVVFSLCSGAVLEQLVVGQALVTFGLVFSPLLESTKLPTLNTSKNTNTFYLRVSVGDARTENGAATAQSSAAGRSEAGASFSLSMCSNSVVSSSGDSFCFT